MIQHQTAFWRKDWFLALALSMIVAIAAGIRFDPLIAVENSAYDAGLAATTAEASNKIAIVAIDEESLSNVGRWPWSRDIHAQLIETLNDGGAKVITHTAFFFEPQTDKGVQLLSSLATQMDSAGLTNFNNETFASSGEQLQNLKRFSTQSALSEQNLFNSQVERIELPIISMRNQLDEAITNLDSDRILSDAIAEAGNVILPMSMPTIDHPPLGKPDHELPPFITQFRLDSLIDNNNALTDYTQLPYSVVNAEYPLAEFSQHASVGSLNSRLDQDGTLRREPLVVDYYGDYYPSLALMTAANSLNLTVEDIQVNLGQSIAMGGLEIGTDARLQMQTFFYSDENIFNTDSVFDILSNKVPANKFKDKIVLIGTTSVGLGGTQITPVNPSMPSVVTLAHSVSSILEEDFFLTPSWTIWGSIITFVLVTLFLMLALPRLKAMPGAIATVILFCIILITHFYLMTQQRLWIPLMTASVLLVLGYLILTTKRFLLTERGKDSSDKESAESNRMLGLAFQGQGQLDIAFEKFRKCPKDDALAEAMFNLGLDFERKRQFGKARNVYEYIYEFNAAFKDVADRVKRNKKMEETLIISGQSHSSTSTLITEDSDIEKPMLGRYQVEKELGKGAMGIVYLGKDPKISRVVAIKTMALANEFEGSELEDVKARFFREAETAGRLNHPNIVTIYDAGEEQDLAYIAMEFLKGKDLADNTKVGELLPIGKVFEIIAKCALALDYAHKQDVVHRDIKPANIMFHQESNEIKITDFGIARITDSSKTKTGVVLGTPSYMSPEQLSGQKVDGRSDLFSLGVMFYQMVSGKLPFKADSMAALMYKITNDEAKSLSEVNNKLPKELDTFVSKALSKDVESRYQTGAEMAAALKKTIAQIKGRRAN